MTHDETPVVDNKDLRGFLGPWPVHNDRARLRAEYDAKVDQFIKHKGPAFCEQELDAAVEMFTWFACMDFLETRDVCIPAALLRLHGVLEERNEGIDHYEGEIMKSIANCMLGLGDSNVEPWAVQGYAMLTARYLRDLLTIETRNRMFGKGGSNT